MKYSNFYYRFATNLFKKEMYQCYSKEYVDDLFSKTKPIYKDLLSKLTGMSHKNPMASNIYLSFVVLAIWEASERKLPVEELGDLLKKAVDVPIFKNLFGIVNMNKPSGVKLFSKLMHSSAAYCTKHPEETNVWDFHFDENKHQDGFYYHFTYCPINDFCKKNGYEELLPQICAVDYITMSYMHSKLIRNETLSTGGKVCDYWTVGDKLKDPK